MTKVTIPPHLHAQATETALQLATEKLESYRQGNPHHTPVAACAGPDDNSGVGGMNWREKLADWISGGKLSNEMTAAHILCLDAADSRAEVAKLKEHAAQETEFLATVTAAKHRAELEAEKLRRDLNVLLYDNGNGWKNSERFSAAMRAIVACETPSANATVKRMASIAREALGEP